MNSLPANNFVKPQYLEESTVNQTFSFEAIRSELERDIDMLKKDPQKYNAGRLQDLIYTSLTRRTQTGQDVVTARQNDPLYQKYGQAWKNWLLSSGAGKDDPNWAQWDIGKRTKVDGKTYNFYITVDFSDPENTFRRYWAGLPDLYKRLQALSQRINAGISFKTSRPFDALLNHNDTLKVYYDNPQYKSFIADTVRTWAAENKIPLGSRAYSHGTDAQGTSFGDLAAKSLAQALINGVVQNPGYTSKQWVDWLNVYAPKILKDTH